MPAPSILDNVFVYIDISCSYHFFLSNVFSGG